MKLLGALAVMAACVSAGVRLNRERAEELALLRELCRGVERVHAELATSLRPLPELCAQLGGELSGAAGAFFRSLAESMPALSQQSFFELWQSAAGRSLSALAPEERSALLQLGQALGRFELQEQLGACERCRESLADAAAERKERSRNERKLTLALSGAAGALLCLLLL
ncbi:MAG: stage III sporulation protein AB [Oscillospiraceae bacterium]|nr:stage III sporulation protein AB [Oscillospiraceae bacterium]